jgi:O-antigen ligase
MNLLNKISRPELLRYALPLCGIVIISRTFPVFSALYYVLPLFLLWFIAAAWKYISVKEFRSLMIFIGAAGVWTALTSIWSDYPLISLTRSGYFILLSLGMTAAGHLFMENKSSSPGGFLLPANIAVMALCVFSFLTDIPADAWTGGHGKGFMSFAGHQNLLASAILFTVPSSIYFFLAEKTPSKIVSGGTLNNLLAVFLLLLNIFFLVITYSRASLLSYVILILLFGIFLFKWKAVIAYVLFALFLAALFFLDTSFRESVEKSLLKGFPTLFFSREILVEPSYRAALKGGAAGFGYGISDPEIILPGVTGSIYLDGRYVREKGNSVLALVEETGIIGLILFLIPVIFVLRNFASSRKHGENNILKKTDAHLSPLLVNSFLFSVVAALIVHAQFEAWWVGPGSIQLPLFFVYLGALAAPKRLT